MLFKITREPIFKDNPELKAIPEFVSLSERELRYIFLTYDYKSPLREMEWAKRKEKAATMAGFLIEKGTTRLDKNGRNTISGGLPKVEAAIEVFKELQFDEDYEDLLAFRDQLKQFREFLRKPDKTSAEMEKAIKIMKEMPDIKKKKKELELQLNLRSDEEVEDAPEENLSAIDEYNSEKYR